MVPVLNFQFSIQLNLISVSQSSLHAGYFLGASYNFRLSENQAWPERNHGSSTAVVEKTFVEFSFHVSLLSLICRYHFVKRELICRYHLGQKGIILCSNKVGPV